jgi:outer membrane protein OmpA-like peptidoglycan-associated protein
MTTITAQKKGKRSKSTNDEVLDMTFEKIQDKETVSELGAISMLEFGVSSPTDNQADLYQKGAGDEFGVPNNVFGSEMTSEQGGSVYAGIVAYTAVRDAYRSYITIPFLKGKENISLSKGLQYCVQFDVSLAESSKFACKHVGAYLSKEAPSLEEEGNLYMSENVIKGKHNRIHKGFFGWDKVCEIYTAKGNEKFITIGNFDRITDKDKEVVKKPKTSDVETLKHAYYYVDNVTVKLIDSEEKCQCFATNQMANVEEYSTLVYAKAANIDETMSLAEKFSANVAYFGFGKKDFTAGSKEALKFVAGQLKSNPELTIVISGHADAKEEELGTTKDELKDMGMVRAKYAERYFMAQGIDASRLTVKSMGAEVNSREIADVDDEELKAAKNRRVEFSVD